MDVNPLFEPSKIQDYFLISAVFWVIIPFSSETAPYVSSALKIEAMFLRNVGLSPRYTAV
jgi:hypothetical protein